MYTLTRNQLAWAMAQLAQAVVPPMPPGHSNRRQCASQPAPKSTRPLHHQKINNYYCIIKYFVFV